MYIGLSKSQNAMCFLSSNISVFPRKTTFSISRPGINLASPNRLKIDQFHSIRVSHLVSAEKLKYNQLFADLFLVQKSTIAIENWINLIIWQLTKAECCPTWSSTVGEKN